MCPADSETQERSPGGGGRFGPYTIITTLGAGGMGIVYRAHDERLGRDVAIKVVRSGLLGTDAEQRRFRKEALALGKLNHPNIAAIYDVGVQDGSYYIVMEYVKGRTLRERLAEEPLSPMEVLSLGSEIAAALDEAHEQGVVHRDLKPANIMVTPKGHAKILDFGLAKLLPPVSADDVTEPIGAETAGIVGTPLYMSPEQAEGRAVDARTDLWSLGVVLYESMAGAAPFRGDSGFAILRSITQDAPHPLRQLRPDIPAEAEEIISRALEKDAGKRYQSASEMASDLSAAALKLSSPAIQAATPAVRVSRIYAIGFALLLVLVAGAGAWSYHRSERRRWAREEAIPAALKLFDADRPLAAFALLHQAERWLPGDPQIAKITAEHSSIASIESSPSGAEVEIQDYLAPEMPPVRLGVTPLHSVRIPNGYFRWKLSIPGGREMIAAPLPRKQFTFDFDAQKSAPGGMVAVPATTWFDLIAFVGWLGPYRLPAYDIDRLEVTNRQYQKFVDSSGYAKREWWRAKFVRDGRELTWNDGMKLLRDRTGRAGPSTWQGGHYPEGQDDYPVSGVSWYEASAYAAFAGKSLPVLAQWYQAAPPNAAALAVHQSNISRTKPAPAGAFKGVGPYGTLDMVGNVREWVANATDDAAEDHFLLGGAWNSPSYLAVDPEALPAFDRSPSNGFRCVRNLASLPAGAAGPITTRKRNFDAFKPASDEVFRVYRAMYSYNRKAPLNAGTEGAVEKTADWRKEKVTFDAAYGNERITAYLFLPQRVRPPFETVLFFPSARVLDIRDSRDLGDIKFFDYIVQSGRAVLYPVYKGTYERQERMVLPGNRKQTDLLVQRFEDAARAVDYLHTRSDIDGTRLAYLGVSMGAAEGVIYTTLLQDEFRTAIFLDGGYFLNDPQPGSDQADFAPRLKKPVLMVNGRYDYTFSMARSQEPLFRMLGTPPAYKEHVVLESPHDVTSHKAQLVSHVLAWLDKYLGRVE